MGPVQRLYVGIPARLSTNEPGAVNSSGEVGCTTDRTDAAAPQSTTNAAAEVASESDEETSEKEKEQGRDGDEVGGEEKDEEGEDEDESRTSDE